MRILLSTNIPFSYSGYATTSREIYKRIKEEGHDLALSNFFGMSGYTRVIEGIKHYPVINDHYGADAMNEHGKDFNADIVISNQDSWVLDLNQLRQIKRYVPWVPIDHDPVPDAVIQRMRLAYRIITCSKFGRDQLKSFGLHSTYIPYSVDTNIFKKRDKLEMRKKFGVPEDAFIFGMVAANKDNPSRKSFQEVLDAFKMFLQAHSDAYLYLNVPIGNPQGFPILEYARFLGVAERVLTNRNYDIFMKFTHENVAEIINTFDVMLNPSMSEGFGLAMIESQACEIPVIGNRFTSMPELVQENKTGWLTEVNKKRFSHLLSYVGEPDTKDLYEKMELSYTAEREKMGQKGREFVKSNFDTDYVFKNMWVSWLQMVDNEIKE